MPEVTPDPAGEVPPADAALLRVVTLNMAHGRPAWLKPPFRPASVLPSLDAIAALLAAERPAVVALQEADGPSLWRGDLDHVRYLARTSSLPYAVRGEHARPMRLLSYGTALLSRLPLDAPASVRFTRFPSPLPKGFLLATLPWPSVKGGEIDVVSAHLDPLLPAARRSQAAEIVEVLARRGRPLVVMGDFNCGWTSPRSALRLLADGLSLRSHLPEATSMATFPLTGRRLDWILVSRELDFRSYRALPDLVSDHRAVLADIVPASGS